MVNREGKSLSSSESRDKWIKMRLGTEAMGQKTIGAYPTGGRSRKEKDGCELGKGNGDMFPCSHREASEFAGSSTPGPWCLSCVVGLIPGYREFR